jgi:hypothetical protein
LPNIDPLPAPDYEASGSLLHPVFVLFFVFSRETTAVKIVNANMSEGFVCMDACFNWSQNNHVFLLKQKELRFKQIHATLNMVLL